MSKQVPGLPLYSTENGRAAEDSVDSANGYLDGPGSLDLTALEQNGACPGRTVSRGLS